MPDKENGDNILESTRLLNGSEQAFSGSNSDGDRVPSFDTVVFDSRILKTSSRNEDLAATWGGRRSLPDSGRLRRVHSWSGGSPDDGSSEIRILRERLVRTQTRPRPGAVRHLSRRQRLTLASLAMVDFMSFCSMSIMAPFFPKEAADKGLSDTMCGLVFSFYAIIMFVTSPVFGKFLPALGAKFLFIIGMFVAGACNVLFGTLVLIEDTTTFTVLCFVIRGLEALGASAYSTASYVFVVNAFPQSIGSVLGILETFVGLGMSVGPALGGLLYSLDWGLWSTVLCSWNSNGIERADELLPANGLPGMSILIDLWCGPRIPQLHFFPRYRKRRLRDPKKNRRDKQQDI